MVCGGVFGSGCGGLGFCCCIDVAVFGVGVMIFFSGIFGVWGGNSISWVCLVGGGGRFGVVGMWVYSSRVKMVMWVSMVSMVVRLCVWCLVICSRWLGGVLCGIGWYSRYSV